MGKEGDGGRRGVCVCVCGDRLLMIDVVMTRRMYTDVSRLMAEKDTFLGEIFTEVVLKEIHKNT